MVCTEYDFSDHGCSDFDWSDHGSFLSMNKMSLMNSNNILLS